MRKEEGRRTHAIVLGASLAGLAAARALSAHFDRVTVVERDVLSEEASLESRKGVPQGNHGHLLLVAGYHVLREYYPGIVDELVAKGANLGDVTGDFLMHSFGSWKLRTNSGVSEIFLSRPFLDSQVYKYTRRLEKVGFLFEQDVLEPVFDPQRGAVTAVRVQNRASGQACELSADLVIDATGRGSMSPKWLAAWGYGHVDETNIRCDVGYATGHFERRPDDCHGSMGALIIGTPPISRRAGGMFAVEGQRWIITLAGLLRDYPPIELEGFREFGSTLPSRELFDVIRDREPLIPIRQYRFPENSYYHYENLPRFPEGYLVIGDAICSLNPLYGQGMAVSLLEAKALDACLASAEGSLARRFFKQTAKILQTPWSIAVGEDMRFSEVKGKRPFGFSLINRYMEGVHRAAAKDPVVLRRMLEVSGLLTPPAAIFAPNIALRVLMGGWGTAQASPANRD